MGASNFIVSRRIWNICCITCAPSPTRDVAPVLTWRHPCPDDEQSPRWLFDFPWSQSRAQILQYKQNIVGALLSRQRATHSRFSSAERCWLTNLIPRNICRRSSLLTVLCLLNMTNLKFDYLRYQLKYIHYCAKLKAIWLTAFSAIIRLYYFTLWSEVRSFSSSDQDWRHTHLSWKAFKPF